MYCYVSIHCFVGRRSDCFQVKRNDGQPVEKPLSLLPIRHVLVEQGHKRFAMARYAQVAKLVQKHVIKTDFGLLGELGLDAAHLRRGEELALAFATVDGEVAHQIFVGIAQDVVIIGPVAGEVEGGLLKDGDQAGEPVHQLLAAAQLGLVVEVGKVAGAQLLIGRHQRSSQLAQRLEYSSDLRMATASLLALGPRSPGQTRHQAS